MQKDFAVIKEDIYFPLILTSIGGGKNLRYYFMAARADPERGVSKGVQWMR